MIVPLLLLAVLAVTFWPSITVSARPAWGWCGETLHDLPLLALRLCRKEAYYRRYNAVIDAKDKALTNDDHAALVSLGKSRSLRSGLFRHAFCWHLACKVEGATYLESYFGSVFREIGWPGGLERFERFLETCAEQNRLKAV